MTREALVTIAMTAYDAQETIEAALASAAAQTWHPREIVVVDDASGDRTPELLERFAARVPDVRIVRHGENRGVGAARNSLLVEARGAFVVFFDDDDVSEPRRVEAQVDRIVAYERLIGDAGPVVCHAARLARYPDGVTRRLPAMGEAAKGWAPSGHAVADAILRGTATGIAGACATCSQAARIETYRTVGGFDESFRRGEDTDLAVRLARAGAHFVGLEDALVHQTMTRTTDKSLEAEREAFLMLLEKNRDFLDQYGEYDFSRGWIEVRHHWMMRRRVRFAGGLLALLVRNPVATARRLRHALPRIADNEAHRAFLGGDPS
ncbi:glycosyltransferase family 2 protein [Salinarimonas ramus]|uniref:Glycosyl transferase n=1 Tax=Salinarimonas ramus TaxID=690164 RepID=A0A917QEJ3_9HYPH|nr:glycosyltransferase family 2 protein [Salinarimonas ramus]GGK47037.1 glycosyl transferase [Salinarimonas ramus]